MSWFTFDESILEERNVLHIDPRKFRVAENGSLFVSDARYIDEKTYMCVSDSPGLKANATASLDVYGELNLCSFFWSLSMENNFLYENRITLNLLLPINGEKIQNNL